MAEYDDPATDSFAALPAFSRGRGKVLRVSLLVAVSAFTIIGIVGIIALTRPSSNVTTPASPDEPSASAVAPSSPTGPVVVALDDSLNIGVFSQVDGHQISRFESGLSPSVTQYDDSGQAWWVQDGLRGQVGRDVLDRNLTKIAVVHRYSTSTVPAYFDIREQKIHDLEPPPDNNSFAQPGTTDTETVGYDPSNEDIWYVLKEDVKTYPAPSSFLVGPNYRKEIPHTSGTSTSTEFLGLRFPQPGAPPDVFTGDGWFNARNNTWRPVNSDTSFGRDANAQNYRDTRYVPTSDLPQSGYSFTAPLISENEPGAAFFFTSSPRMGIWKVSAHGGNPTELAPVANTYSHVVRAGIG